MKRFYIQNKTKICSNLVSLNSDRRRFVTMWRYNFDDAFHGGVKVYTKHQKLLDFWILSTKMSKKIVENGPQCFIPRELVIFEFFLFELVRYSADRNMSSDWTKMILLLLDNYWHYWEFISHNFVDKRQNNRNFLTICLSFCSMKCVIKEIPPRSSESPSVWIKAELEPS